jgi:predicted transcriptional regulator
MPTSPTTGLKLDAATKSWLQRLAAARRHPTHRLMREAIEQYLEREEARGMSRGLLKLSRRRCAP